MAAENIINGYRIDDLLGNGQYGSVYRVSKESETYAMKKFDRLKQTTPVEQIVIALDEMYRLRSVRHPFMIRYYESFRRNGPEFYVIMELCTGVNMKTDIRNTKEQNGAFPVAKIELWLVQLLMAVNHLHHKRIVHRELKPNNVFIMQNYESVKLGDFSLVKALSLSGSVALSSGRRERESYRAPELWKGLSFRCNVDEWSLGCLVYELLCLRPPFHADKVEDIVNAHYEPILAGQVDNGDLISVMQKLLTADPAKRPHAVQILQEPVLIRAKNETCQIYRDELLTIQSTSALPPETDEDLSALEVNSQGEYPPQSWAIPAEDSLVRLKWQDIVDGYGGALAFRPYSLTAQYGSYKVYLWLVRPEPNWSDVSLGYKQDMRIWVQTLPQPNRRLRLGFEIKMQFTTLNGDIFEFEEEDLDAMANETEKSLFWTPQFDWDKFDREKPPTATVNITPEWL